MAAFTTFSGAALARYLRMFGKGELAGFTPIAGGIENSNYLVTLREDGVTGDYVLTIIEALTFAEAPFFARVLSRLYHYGLPVAAPQATLDGMTATIFCGKPAFLFPKLPGAHPDRVEAGHCRQLGAFIGACHRALADIGLSRDNPYSLAWMTSAFAGLRAKLTAVQSRHLAESIADYERLQGLDLPRGIIHGDLFRDNALFDEAGALSGVIDFYHACEDLLIQDIAIAINDWCLVDGSIDATLKSALIAGYEGIRPLTAAESDALAPLQRTSAARFALTRLLSGEPPLKHPGEMLALMAALQD